MSTKDLEKYGMKYVGNISISKDNFIIDTTRDEDGITGLKECIYAFIVGEEIVRIGSSKKILRERFNRWEKDVSARLKEKESVTSKEQAEAWRKLLKGKHGKVYARKGHLIKTPVGEFHAYLSEEKKLIEHHNYPRFSKR